MADQVAEVKSKTDIVEIISEHVDLKKAGSNYKGLCPFHGEKTPSFMVSPELQIYKCFGCDRSGDAYSFLMEYEAMEFPEALKTLADRAGVKLVKRRSQGTSEKEKLYEINSITSRFYQYVLLKHPAGKSALDYLLKDRGLKKQTILDFQLGFSPETPGALQDFLVGKKKQPKQVLTKSGIFYERNSKLYDRFRGRAIFPLHDHRGNVAGFAGRLMPKDSHKKLAKYINTPETPVYHKSDLLYGLNTTKTHIKRTNCTVLVEGELDVISTYQAGIKNTVAIKGSALTTSQSKLLKRFANQLVFALDTDEAGIEATTRGIKIAQKDEFEVRVAVLGKAKDPDELARSDPKKLLKLIDNSIGGWDFVIDTIFTKHNIGSGTGKAKISREVIPVLASIDDEIVRAHYVGVVAKKLQVPEESVAKQLGSKAPSPETLTETKKVEPEKANRKTLLEHRLVAVSFKRKYDQKGISSAIKLIDTVALKKLLQNYVKHRKANKKFDPARFAEELPKELVNIYAQIVLKDELSGVDVDKEYEEIVTELQTVRLKQELLIVTQDIKKHEKSGDKKKLKSSQRKFNLLTQKLGELGSN